MTSANIEELVGHVAAKKDEWAGLAPEDKLVIIDSLMDNMNKYATLLQECSERKRDGILGKDNATTYSTKPAANLQTLENCSNATHWLHSTMVVVIWLSEIRGYFESIIATGRPPAPLAVKTVKEAAGNDAELRSVKVGPKGLLFQTMLSMGSMELIVEGQVEQEIIFKRPGGVSVVMGAGNFDGPVDLLSALFIDNNVCIYKRSPYNNELQGVFQEIFAPLLERNFMAFTEGGPEVCKALINHPLVSKWYLTGAAKTAYSILWGTPTPPALTDPVPVPLVTKPFVCELGNCTPWIICPGNWSSMELDWHASNIAAALIFNGAHICAHPQLIVTCKAWPQRENFLGRIRSYLMQTKYVGCYYPDFVQRLDSVKDRLISLGMKPEEFEVPITCPLSSFDNGGHALIFATDMPKDCLFAKEEMFMPASGEVALDVPMEIAEFLSSAVKYVNEEVNGNLSVSVSIKTKTTADEEALEKAILDFRYGSVNINTDTKIGFAFPALVWGGYPGSTIFDLSSGIGYNGNCCGYKRPLKGVVRAPFLNFTQILLKPPSQGNAKKMAKLWRRIASAIGDRRGSKGWWNFTGHVSTIVSAFVANL